MISDEAKRFRAILAIQKFHGVHRRTPYYKELGQKGSGVPCFRVLRRLFGSVEEAMLAAGYTARVQGPGRFIVEHKPAQAKAEPRPPKVRRPIIGRDYWKIEETAKAQLRIWEQEFAEEMEKPWMQRRHAQWTLYPKRIFVEDTAAVMRAKHRKAA